MIPFVVRKAKPEDLNAIADLYRSVARQGGGIARGESEITEAYVRNFTEKAQQNGFQVVCCDENKALIGELHCYPPEPGAFAHVLGELTVVVSPGFQGQGIGKKMFQTLLDLVRRERPGTLRVELITRESNKKAIKRYQSLGFVIEGRLEKRILGADGQLEADIPMAWFNPDIRT